MRDGVSLSLSLSLSLFFAQKILILSAIVYSLSHQSPSIARQSGRKAGKEIVIRTGRICRGCLLFLARHARRDRREFPGKLLPVRLVCQSGAVCHRADSGCAARAYKPTAALIMTAQHRLTTSSSPRAFMKQYACIYPPATPLCLHPVSPRRANELSRLLRACIRVCLSIKEHPYDQYYRAIIIQYRQ